MSIPVAKVDPNAQLPTIKHRTDAGADFYALEHYDIEPFSFRIVRTGVAVKLPVGTIGQLWPKSRSNYLIGGGIVDEGYQGEILFKVINPYPTPLTIAQYQAVGQMVIVPNARPRSAQEVFWQEDVVEEFEYGVLFQEKTDRGATGGIVNQ